MTTPTRTPRIRRTATALGLVTCLALASCSQLEPARDKALPAAAEAKTGGTLKVGITDPGPISPMSTTTTAGRMIAAALCDTLLVRDPATNQLREGIADTWVEASDGSFVTIRPIHGVKFNDGSTINAKDIAMTLRQVVAKVNDSPYAALATPFGSGVIANPDSDQSQQEYKAPDLLADGTGEGPDLAQPLNDYDVQMQSNVPNATAAAVFAEIGLAPISAAAFTKDPAAFDANPVCIGPYKLEKPRAPKDTVITLVRAKDYYAKNLGYTNGGRGYADRIEFHLYPDHPAVDAAYKAGEIDIAEALPTPSLPLKSRYDAPKIEPHPTYDPPLQDSDLVRSRPIGVDYFGLTPMADSRWNSEVVRRALSMAIDRTALAKTLGPAFEPATGFLPPALAVEQGRRGRTKSVGMEIPGCSSEAIPVTPDGEGARKLLKDADIDLKPKDEFDSVMFSFGRPPRDASQFSAMSEIAKELKDSLGIEAQLIAEPWDDFSARVYSEGSVGVDGMFKTSWASTVIAPTPTYDDPSRYLRSLFTVDGIGLGNASAWQDPGFDQVMGELDKAATVADRATVVKKANSILCEKMPLIPLTFSRKLWRVRSSAVGLARKDATGTDGVLLLRELYAKKGDVSAGLRSWP